MNSTKSQTLVLTFQNPILKFSKYILLFVFIFSGTTSFSQSKKQLQKDKEKIEQYIKQTNKVLQKTKNKKNSSLHHLKVLNTQVKNKEKLLKNLDSEIKYTNYQIEKIIKSIEKIENTILKKQVEKERLKQEYAKMIYQSFVWKNTYNDLFFLISSEDFNQLSKRKQYLKQIRNHRTSQIKKIEQNNLDLFSEKENLEVTKEKLTTEKQNKDNLVLSKKTELQDLNSQKKEKNNLIVEIKLSENKYKEKLKNQQLKSQELEIQIKKIIEEEIRKSRDEAEKNNNGSPLTPEALELSANFESNKGSLPWPLEKGIIVQTFGKQKHSVFAGVETINNGIDIATDPNQIIRSVFDGKISRIFFIKGEGKAILINHGSYFTVYSGLKDVIVKIGEKVYSKQKLGIVITSESENITELHFEIWKGKDKQNPVKWLYKAY